MESTRPDAPRADRLPPWLKVRAPSGEAFARIKGLRRDLALATVCEEARCPNIAECWGAGTATFMVMGDTCTRHCRFCNVKTGNPRGVLDGDEPAHLARAVASMDLSYVVITMVDRDDLLDGGAGHVLACVDAVREASPAVKVELLMGDFRGRRDLLHRLASGGAHVLAHNVETVPSLTRTVRDGKCGYDQSLASLRILKEGAPGKLTKSSLMLGLGESPREVEETLSDLRGAGVDIVTIGQYLRPTQGHLAVKEYVHPDVFAHWQRVAMDLGFLFCASGPLVRSSYKAGELFTERWLRERDRTSPPVETPAHG